MYGESNEEATLNSLTHVCVSKLTIIGPDNGLAPTTVILLIGPLGTNFSEILIGIYTFSFPKMHWKMLSGKCRPFCLGLNVLTRLHDDVITYISRTYEFE